MSSASVSMIVPASGDYMTPFIAAIRATCQREPHSYMPARDAAERRKVSSQILAGLDDVKSIQDLCGLSDGTITVVNGSIFIRSSRYACDGLWDHYADIFSSSVPVSFTVLHITDIAY